MINLIWGIFNLLPIYPMDGGKLLSALLARFCSPKVAPKAAIVISMLFCVALLGYFFIQKNVFMILIGLYLLMINFTGAKQAFTSIEARTQERASLEAEKLYEYGLIAAREHRWKDLENFGFLMKNAASSDDQRERAYEFLTIACTNTFRYEDALKYAEHARQSDSVKKAVERCHRALGD